ncbi:MAG: hypothetical protein KF723_00220 [Rhizobiaceae bacterium]|nr:hypothetical protein [Rhizobiaceae bacterium]
MQSRQLVPSFAEVLFFWLQRVAAVYCLAFGVLYWIRLIGVYEGPLWRFDLMPVHWQVTAVTLAAIFPVASIGLWMLTSWGPVMWFICAAIEIVMYAGFPDLFGENWLIVGAHAAVALLYAILRVVIYFEKRPFR